MPDPQLSPALLTLLLVVIGALTALVEKVRRDLSANTNLTQETKKAANGTLTDALARVAAERNRVFALRMVLRERDDRIAFIVARHPEVEESLSRYEQRRSSRSTEADELAAEQRLLADPALGETQPLHVPPAPPDDPTGTDAGAYPQG